MLKASDLPCPDLSCSTKAVVKDVKVMDYVQRPLRHGHKNAELQMAMSHSDAAFARKFENECFIQWHLNTYMPAKRYIILAGYMWSKSSHYCIGSFHIWRMSITLQWQMSVSIFTANAARKRSSYSKYEIVGEFVDKVPWSCLLARKCYIGTVFHSFTLR